jgi:hypothetical protein
LPKAHDVSVNRIQGKLAINLVNTAGPHADLKSPIHDSIPLIGPLTISIRTEKAPSRIMVQPENTQLESRFSDGKTTLTLPRLTIHSVLIVE